MQTQSVFFIELDKIKPNPLQPRQEFDEIKLSELAESIRSYGVLQPLVVVRKELTTSTGVQTEYELITGERRLRAARLAGLRDVPVIIREEPADKIKLELALVENVQREDLNAVDRAKAFQRLGEEFSLTHRDIGAKIGKSREYVANSIRLLSLSDEILTALREGRITESHCRYLLALQQKPEEQKVLLDDIVLHGLNVRETERITKELTGSESRVRPSFDLEIKGLEERLAQSLGGRVYISRSEKGGRVSIEFFTPEELRAFVERFTPEMVPDLTSGEVRPEDLEEFTI